MPYTSISIITPSFNQGQYIEQTILSVLEQKYPNLQYIIIDGGSTDNTVEVIKKYEQHLAYWVSEKDSGQANAINKGLPYCTGEIFNWLNSDDYLQPGSLQKIATAFSNQSVDLVAGMVNNFSTDKSDIVANCRLSAAGLMRWDRGVQFNQPGVWMRRKQFIECGGLNEAFHYAFDWDMMIRYLSLFPEVKYLPDTLVNFRLHAASKTVSAQHHFTEEEQQVIEALYSNPVFNSLHPVCKYKIDRTAWTRFLNETIHAVGTTKAKKILCIIKQLHNQPLDAGITRMTLGAFKQVLLG